MPKFRTKIAHKAGSSIDVFGLKIDLTPDEGQGDPAICVFDVPDDRDDVFARLSEIPEGFELIDDAAAAEPQEQGQSFVVENGSGEKVDLYQLDRPALVAIGTDIGLTFGGRLGINKVREQIIARMKG